MFNRVSTVDLGLYANNNQGVFLGKKWAGGYQEIDGKQYQVLSGWRTYVDKGSDGYRVLYPDYSLPNNLPNFVNGDTSKTHEYSYAKRFLIGAGTPALGPMSLKDALFIYSVVKKISIEGSIYAPDGQSSDTKIDVPSETINENDPIYLFRPQFKSGQEMEFFAYVSYVEGEDTTMYESGQQINFTGRQLFIVIDVDDLKNYYIVGFPIGWGDTPTDGGIYTHWQQVESGYPNRPTQAIEQTFSYTFGSINTSHTYKVFYNHSFSFKATEFWPYKNANNQPVYNTTTGAITNQPVP